MGSNLQSPSCPSLLGLGFRGLGVSGFRGFGVLGGFRACWGPYTLGVLGERAFRAEHGPRFGQW